jgi:hypothetical protein
MSPQDRLFWTIVDRVAEPSTEAVIEALHGELSKLTPAQLIGYQKSFVAAMSKTNTPRHLGSATVIMGFTSDDVFVSLRTWVLYQGSDVYGSYVTDPDSLAPNGPTDDEQVGMAEELEFMPEAVYEEMTGNDLASALPDEPTVYDQPQGPAIDMRSESLAKQFPRLAASYLQNPAPSGKPIENGPRPITRH